MYSDRAWRQRASGLCCFHNLLAAIRPFLIFTLLTASPGCMFMEHSFPVDAEKIVRADTPEGLSARQWLARAHDRLKSLLPPDETRPTLVTEDLCDSSGRPADLVDMYRLKPDKLESLFVNWTGLSYSAQVTGPDTGTAPAPQWPGFTDVWVPIHPKLKLSGRLGLARDSEGKAISTDCIVLLPGLCGGNNVRRQWDIAEALRSGGLHVLAIETRGQGQTAVRYPEMLSTWGLYESTDLLLVSDWLESKPEVKRTGLIGFSWGGVHATLTAWSDGRPQQHLSVSEKLDSILPKLNKRPRYRAGILVFSPVLDLEVLMVKLMTPRSYFFHPVLAGLQSTVRKWKARSGFPDPTGSLHDVIRCKTLQYEGAHADHRRFLRLTPYKGKPCGNKFDDIRVPLLMIHAADDPVTPVQALADLNAYMKNPNVATLILPTGGHIGFAPYAKDWFYSMLLSFFDPDKGPKAVNPRGPGGASDYRGQHSTAIKERPIFK